MNDDDDDDDYDDAYPVFNQPYISNDDEQVFSSEKNVQIEYHNNHNDDNNKHIGNTQQSNFHFFCQALYNHV